MGTTLGGSIVLPIIESGLLITSLVRIRMARNIAADRTVELNNLCVCVEEGLLVGVPSEYSDYVPNPCDYAISKFVIAIDFCEGRRSRFCVVASSRRRGQFAHEVVAKAEMWAASNAAFASQFVGPTRARLLKG